MKILMIVSSGYEEGGIENSLVLMKQELGLRGHVVKILASDSRPDLLHFNDYTYPAPSGALSKLSFVWNSKANRVLKQVLKEYKPDIVHVHTIGFASPSILFALKKIPSVFTIHGPEAFVTELFPFCMPRSYFTKAGNSLKQLTMAGKLRVLYNNKVERPLYFLGLRNIARFITHSHYMQKIVAQDGILSTYVPLGTKLFDSVPLSETPTSHTLLYAGRLEQGKGVEYLLEALPAIVASYPDTTLAIAGEGSARPALTNLVESHNLTKQVQFLGHVTRTQLEEEYKKSTLVIVPSIWPEAFGKIGIEAMSVGRPVIASNVGGISDWLTNNVNGYLVAPKDSAVISQRVVELFDNPAQVKMFSVAARARAEEFTISKEIDHLEGVYNQLLNNLQ